MQHDFKKDTFENKDVVQYFILTFIYISRLKASISHGFRTVFVVHAHNPLLTCLSHQTCNSIHSAQVSSKSHLGNAVIPAVSRLYKKKDNIGEFIRPVLKLRMKVY